MVFLKHLKEAKELILKDLAAGRHTKELLELDEIHKQINPYISLQKKQLGRIIVENSGNIGKSYRRHDEIGTPLCITIDFDSLENNTATIRDRDTMEQKRVLIEEIPQYVADHINKN